MGGAHQKATLFGGSRDKGAAELNYDIRSDHKEVRDGAMGDGQELSEEDQFRVNEAAMDVKESHVLDVAVVVHNSELEKQQHQCPIPIVQWERFLPLRTLRVLLVENDDSTRQVLRALLRNCCYDVTAVANVLEGWKILEDQRNHIDLVLTEVILPCFSGVGLLCKIMSHKTYRTIPVIMMSSNDSMSIVLKCLSKGAVDFLVKPIRKNELKNLWQHVWRRCHGSTGGGNGSRSASGIHGQKSWKSKSEDDSDNATDSNDEGNGSIGWIARDGSDNGSGTQNSWTKRTVEVNSPQTLYPSEQLAAPHDSARAQVIHPKPGTLFAKKNAFEEGQEQKKFTDQAMGKDFWIESCQTDKVSTKLTGPSMDKSTESAQNASNGVRNVTSNSEPSAQVSDKLGGISDSTNQQLVFDSTDTASKASSKLVEIQDKGYMELPFIEQSLKRLRSTREVGEQSSADKTVLKHSSLSAFSRYLKSVPSVEEPTGSVFGNSSMAAPLNKGSNGSSDNYNTSSSINKKVSASAIKCNRPTSAFHLVHPQNFTIQPVEQEMMDKETTASVIGQSRGSPEQVQVHHHHHHHHRQQAQNGAYAFWIPHGSSDEVEANASNHSLKGSNSRRNHGCDGPNEGSIAVTEKGGAGGGYGSECGSGVDQSRLAKREAALNKFRQKRTERNFSKKVRYQSRKRLAEQRPRFRGQFVPRITHNENHKAA